MSFFIILIALFLAMNVGANNSAAEMAAAYKAGVRTRKEALILIAIFVVLGAIISGSPVLNTLGRDLVSARSFKASFYVIFAVMAVAAAFDLISRTRTTIPTTYAIVSSIAAVGIYYKTISTDICMTILKWWLISPLVVFIAAFVLGKFLHFKSFRNLSEPKEGNKRLKLFLGEALTLSGCFVAFAGGANGAGKALGPLVAAGVVSWQWALLLGGAGIAAGALIFGAGALETGEKEITEIGFMRAILIEVICAAVLLLASFKGVPVSVSVTVTSSLMGLGCADSGFFKSAKDHRLIRTCFIWFIVPVFSAGLTYMLLRFLGAIMG